MNMTRRTRANRSHVHKNFNALGAVLLRLKLSLTQAVQR